MQPIAGLGHFLEEQLRLRQQAQEEQRKQAEQQRALQAQSKQPAPQPAPPPATPQRGALETKLDAALETVQRHLPERFWNDNQLEGWAGAGKAVPVIGITLYYHYYGALKGPGHSSTIDTIAAIILVPSGLYFLFGVLKGLFGF